MDAPDRRMTCLSRRLTSRLSGFSLSSSAAIACCSLMPMRSLISAAAARVKVTIKSSSTFQAPSSVSGRRRWLTTRSASTAVLPEPAAADTRIFFPSRSIALCCSFVHAISRPPPAQLPDYPSHPSYPSPSYYPPSPGQLFSHAVLSAVHPLPLPAPEKAPSQYSS